MKRYKLEVTEKSVRVHTVVLCTDRDIDEVCDEMEKNNCGDVHDFGCIDGVKFINVEEGADEMPELEITGCKETDV